MGLRGPKPCAAKVEERLGNPRRRNGATAAEAARADATNAIVANQAVSGTLSDIPAPPTFIVANVLAVAAWNEIWSAPDAVTRVRLKETDAAFIARYGWKRARVDEWMAKPRQRATYVTESTSGAKVRKPSPTYLAMMDLLRGLTADESLMGLTPRSRVDLAHRFAELRASDAVPVTGGGSRAAVSDDEGPPRPDSPLGLLARKH